MIANMYRQRAKGVKTVLRWLASLMLLTSLPVFAQSTNSVTYVYTDPQGTPLAEADASGNITATFEYTPYGTFAPNGTSNPGQNPKGPGYTGHVNDPETNLVYMQARYYDPATGHFLSIDPVALEAGNTFGFNRFAYADNNPIVQVDVDGRESASLTMQGVQAIESDLDNMTQDEAKDSVTTAVSMVPEVGDIQNIVVAAKNPSPTNIVAAVIGLVPDVGGPIAKAVKGGEDVAKVAPDFDAARRAAFEKAGMTDASKIKFSKVDPETGTVVEFKGEGGAKVGYDGPHASPGPHHDTQHISWQSGGKRGGGGGKRGNEPYSGPRHPSRPDRKDQ
jgi:RHS repeat-associated protein